MTTRCAGRAIPAAPRSSSTPCLTAGSPLDSGRAPEPRLPPLRASARGLGGCGGKLRNAKSLVQARARSLRIGLRCRTPSVFGCAESNWADSGSAQVVIGRFVADFRLLRRDWWLNSYGGQHQTSKVRRLQRIVRSRLGFRVRLWDDEACCKPSGLGDLALVASAPTQPSPKQEGTRTQLPSQLGSHNRRLVSARNKLRAAWLSPASMEGEYSAHLQPLAHITKLCPPQQLCAECCPPAGEGD